MPRLEISRSYASTTRPKPYRPPFSRRDCRMFSLFRSSRPVLQGLILSTIPGHKVPRQEGPLEHTRISLACSPSLLHATRQSTFFFYVCLNDNKTIACMRERECSSCVAALHAPTAEHCNLSKGRRKHNIYLVYVNGLIISHERVYLVIPRIGERGGFSPKCSKALSYSISLPYPKTLAEGQQTTGKQHVCNRPPFKE